MTTTRDTGPPAATKTLVLHRAERFGIPRCERCGCVLPEQPHIHHRRPRGIGGSTHPDINKPSNLLVICPGCHDWIERTLRELSYSYGWLVRHTMRRPGDMPVRVHDLSWVWLDDFGGYIDTGYQENEILPPGSELTW